MRILPTVLHAPGLTGRLDERVLGVADMLYMGSRVEHDQSVQGWHLWYQGRRGTTTERWEQQTCLVFVQRAHETQISDSHTQVWVKDELRSSGGKRTLKLAKSDLNDQIARCMTGTASSCVVSVARSTSYLS
jgi:hypothetical protein